MGGREEEPSLQLQSGTCEQAGLAVCELQEGPSCRREWVPLLQEDAALRLQ